MWKVEAFDLLAVCRFSPVSIKMKNFLLVGAVDFIIFYLVSLSTIS